MNEILKHIIKTVNSGNRIKVRCIKEWEVEGTDENMVCDIIKIDTHVTAPEELAEKEILVYMDFMPYLEYNKTHAKPTWYNNFGEPCLTWFETIHWKKHQGKEELYLMTYDFEKYFDVELSPLFKDYLNDKEIKNKSYISYLEEKVMMLANKILKYETNIAIKEDPDSDELIKIRKELETLDR